LKWPTWGDAPVAVALLAGFPVVMYLAWLYDITPQGVKRTGPRRRLRRALAWWRRSA
jgi:hypothetical protein